MEITTLLFLLIAVLIILNLYKSSEGFYMSSAVRNPKYHDETPGEKMMSLNLSR